MEQADVELSAAALSFIMLIQVLLLVSSQCQAAGGHVLHPEPYRREETEDEHAGEVKDGLGRF